MDEKYLNHFESLEFKEYLNNLKEEDEEKYQELIDIINDDRVPTLEEIKKMLEEDEEIDFEEYNNQLDDTLAQLEKLNEDLDKVYEKYGLNTTFEAVREAGYRKKDKREK